MKIIAKGDDNRFLVLIEGDPATDGSGAVVDQYGYFKGQTFIQDEIREGGWRPYDALDHVPTIDDLLVASPELAAFDHSDDDDNNSPVEDEGEWGTVNGATIWIPKDATLDEAWASHMAEAEPDTDVPERPSGEPAASFTELSQVHIDAPLGSEKEEKTPVAASKKRRYAVIYIKRGVRSTEETDADDAAEALFSAKAKGISGIVEITRL